MASQIKSHTFRVTGLSRELPDGNLKTDGDLRTALQEALDDNFTDEERSQIKAEITIVPSCYEHETQRVALVKFRGGVPQFLHELRVDPVGDWQVEMGDEDISFDSHFLGFTQLYAPDDNVPVVADIIAIAGLDGHAYGSWQGRGNLGRMWLRDFLSKDLPQCRTMIYGYNSKLSSHGVGTILDYGRELMEEIKKIRNTKELQQRPLIFIAHSFGGIIMAHCLVRAIQTMEEDHPAITSLHRATYGMILFAIPHKGLVMDDIQQMLAGDKSYPRGQLLQQISSKSDLLIHQLADFKNLIRDRKVVSFYETEQTRRLVLVDGSESGRWKRTGDYITTVDADSALLQLPDHVEDKVPLHADHSMIVKFDKRDAAGYQSVRDRLQQFSKDAPSVVAARFAPTRRKLQPCSTVPFKRDPMFVGREAEISAIKEEHGMISQRHERVAFVGLAGVGKTQTAIEYSYRLRESAPDMWVFWIHASNTARFEQSYQHIATVAEIPGQDDPKMNILQLVYQWLFDVRNGRWLMVLDNVDDDSIFFRVNESNERGPLVRFLPQVAHGSILITSRNGLAARNLVGSDGHMIEVQPMNEEKSLTLLRTRIPSSQPEESEESEKALVQALEYIPLAITQAAAYIANRLPLLTVSAYLQLFRESESNQMQLLQSEDSTDLRRDPSIRYAVITTWQLSFEQIRQDRPAATDLLALMSMFDRQGIPEDLVRESEQDELEFHDALVPLLNYSLIRLEINERLFDIHHLVQLSVRAWLDIHQQLHGWQTKSRGIMARIFPNGQYKNWAQCRLLLAHAKSVLTSINNIDDEDQLNAARLSSNCARFLFSQGKYEEAETLLQPSLRAREKVLGREHPDTLDSINGLGNVFLRLGRYKEAEAMYRQALEVQEKVLRREHPDTLTSVSSLGLVFFSLGKYEEAEAIIRRALEAQERVLGREHPNTLTSVSNLGSVLSSQGKYEEAEAIIRRALEVRERVLGREHPATLNSVSNLGSVLSSQGKYEEAEAMHRRDLEVNDKLLGHEHPDTLASVGNLGLVLYRQERYKEAEAMLLQALDGYEKVLGQEHPDTLTSVTSFGLVLSKQGRYEEAEAMYRRALEVQEKVLGREHPDTLTSVSNLGSVFFSLGKYEEAEAMNRWTLEVRERVLGWEDHDTLSSVSNLALVLSRQGKYEKAEAMHRRALEVQEKVLGHMHPDTLARVYKLGNLLSSQGKYEEAAAMLRRATEAQSMLLGREHPSTLASVSSLGSVLSSQGKYEEAEAMHRWALEAQEKVLGHEHPDTLARVYKLGNLLSNLLSSQGRYEEAAAILRRAKEAQSMLLGREHPPNTGQSMAYLSPHSVRSDDVVVPQPGMQVQSGSSTALYLISEPLPAKISILDFRITSHDQGFCGDPSQGTWTWFEVSIVRPWCEEPGLDIENIEHSSGFKSHPEDFGDLIQERGWYFADISIQNEGGSTSTDSISREILSNPVSGLWSHKRITWSKEGPGGDFVSLIQEGDRLLVWARAQYPGWVNYVREVQIALKTADSMDFQQEESPLPTLNSRTLMQQGNLRRTILSTPHPLLQMSQMHHRSMGGKEDFDVD